MKFKIINTTVKEKKIPTTRIVTIKLTDGAGNLVLDKYGKPIFVKNHERVDSVKEVVQYIVTDVVNESSIFMTKEEIRWNLNLTKKEFKTLMREGQV